MHNKKDQLLSIAYISSFVFGISLLKMNQIPWRDAMLLDFIREFTNLIPGRGIVEALQQAMRYGFSLRNPIFLHLVALLPLGVYLGLHNNHMEGRDILIQCRSSILLLSILYALRLLLKLGSFDIDDILLNTAGFALGSLLGKWIYTHRCMRNNQ